MKAKDFATLAGVTPATVAIWCAKGIVNAEKRSDGAGVAYWWVLDAGPPLLKRGRPCKPRNEALTPSDTPNVADKPL